MQARKILLEAGWSPTSYAEASMPSGSKGLDDDLSADFLKRGAPEVGACFGTGLDQCFGIWRRKDRLFIVESLGEYDPAIGPTVYFFYQVKLHGLAATAGVPTRDEWDPRSADVVPNSVPKGHDW